MNNMNTTMDNLTTTKMETTETKNRFIALNCSGFKTNANYIEKLTRMLISI
jgi:hypothetical protein